MSMKRFDWDDAKNTVLRTSRGVSFEDVLWCIENGLVLDITETHDPIKYHGQRHFIIQLHDYTYYVPFVEDEYVIFLKTIIPSRKYTRRYRKGETHDT